MSSACCHLAGALYGEPRSLTVFSPRLPNLPMFPRFDEDGHAIGFHVELPNGIRVSVLWGRHRSTWDHAYSNVARRGVSLRDPAATFELAAFWPGADGDFIRLSEYDQVLAYQNREEIREVIQQLASLDPSRDHNLLTPGGYLKLTP